jgi:hypothetical protein
MDSVSLESRPIFIVALRFPYQVGGGFSEDIGGDFSSM